LENAIVPLLPHGKARADEVAGRLGLSPRTLARRLASEGLTFEGILSELRADLAKRYLRDEALAISQIAWLLGYKEVSAFTHAFKRWTGKTPREARSQENVARPEFASSGLLSQRRGAQLGSIPISVGDPPQILSADRNFSGRKKDA
jgi:AraC-like DNA-binding protein